MCSSTVLQWLSRAAVFIFILLSNVILFAKEKPFEKALYSAIKSNNYEETTVLLERFYASYDLSISHKLRWFKDSPFALYNYYNERYHVPGIAVSDFPTQSQTWAYWENWSKHLTASKWNAHTFFKNEKQALEMAQYNILMLMSHELGHHIAHRHSVRNKNLNCHEYTADMASMALIASFTEKSKLAKFQERYLELIQRIKREVADSSRFDALDLDIHAQCDCIDVVFPKDSSLMAQYASAYFARRQMFNTNNRFKSTEEIVDSIFKMDQAAWDRRFPRIKSSSSIVSESVNRFEMNEDARDIYNYYRLLSWGDHWLYSINAIGYDDSGSVYSMQLEWPEKHVKDAIITVPIFDEKGNKYFNWFYVPDSTIIVDKFKFLGFTASDVRKDFSFLTYEVDTNDVGRYCLYTPGRGYFLKKEILNISTSFHTNGDCRLKEVNSDYVVFYANGDNQISEIVYSRTNKRYRTNVLFSLGFGEIYETNWQGTLVCDANDDFFVFPLNDYVLMWYKNNLYTLAGSGIRGTKSNNRGDSTTEFYVIKAIHIKGNKLLIYDEEINSKTDRNIVNMWEVDFELPDQP